MNFTTDSRSSGITTYVNIRVRVNPNILKPCKQPELIWNFASGCRLGRQTSTVWRSWSDPRRTVITLIRYGRRKSLSKVRLTKHFFLGFTVEKAHLPTPHLGLVWRLFVGLHRLWQTWVCTLALLCIHCLWSGQPHLLSVKGGHGDWVWVGCWSLEKKITNARGIWEGWKRPPPSPNWINPLLKLCRWNR